MNLFPIIATFFLIVSFFVPASFAALSVPVEVINWIDDTRSGEPVTAGIPLPECGVYDLSKLRITDGSGNTVPAQFRWLSKWWYEKENGCKVEPSIKWVLCDFQSGSISEKGKLGYTVSDDNTSPAVQTALSVADSSGKIIVTTGPLKFTVSKVAFNLFDELWLDKNNDGTFSGSEQIISSSSSNGGVLTAGEWSAGGCTTGVLHTTTQRPPERVVIEENGPMKVTLRIEGAAARA